MPHPDPNCSRSGLTQAAGRKTPAPELTAALKAAGAEDIIVICGDVIPASLLFFC